MKKKVAPDIEDNFNSTPLHVAAGTGYLEIIKYIVGEKKIDSNVRDCEGNISVHFAAPTVAQK